MKTKTAITIIALTFLFFGMSAAEAPRTLNYQGVLTDIEGAPLFGDHFITFRLYDSATGGSEIWSEADSVTITNGVFSQTLGLTTPLELAFDETYWLSIAVDGEEEMTPRSRLTSSPYALRTALADSVVGGVGEIDGSGTVNRLALFSGPQDIASSDIYQVNDKIGIGTSSPQARLHVDASGTTWDSYTLIQSSPYVGYAGGLLLTNSPNLTGTSFKMTSSYNFSGNGIARFGFVENDATETFIHGPTFELDYSGEVGIGTTPNEKLTVEGVLSLDETSAPSGTAGYGKLYVKSGDHKLYFKSGTGLEYNLTNTGGGGGTVTSISQGTGITCSPNPITGSGSVSFNQTWGDGRYVNEGQENSINPLMISSGGGGNGEALTIVNGDVEWGYPVAQALIVPYAAQVNSQTTLLDLEGTSNYSNNPAILGTRAAHDGYGIGVKGVGGKIGVQGWAEGTGDTDYRGVDCFASGTSGANVYGVYAMAQGGSGGFTAAVYGTATNGMAGYFDGYLYADDVSSGIKEFKIDHPLDPANKYLRHSSVESPDMMNVYNGNVVVDASGGAWIELPDYFEALNQDFRYQLTPVGGPGPNLYVAEEISGNRFRIAGGEPGMKVSWQVTGIRHDPVAERFRVQVEEEKPAAERGKYLIPEVYGVPESAKIGYLPPGETDQ